MTEPSPRLSMNCRRFWPRAGAFAERGGDRGAGGWTISGAGAAFDDASGGAVLDSEYSGLSTPFGGGVDVDGVATGVRRKPWLAGVCVAAAAFAGKRGHELLGALLKVVRDDGALGTAAAGFSARGPGMAALIGLGIASGGSFLFLRIMVPVMNTLPTISILLLAAGLMESDGVLVLTGYIFGAAAWVYFGRGCGWGRPGSTGCTGFFESIHRRVARGAPLAGFGQSPKSVTPRRAKACAKSGAPDETAPTIANFCPPLIGERSESPSVYAYQKELPKRRCAVSRRARRRSTHGLSFSIT